MIRAIAIDDELPVLTSMVRQFNTIPGLELMKGYTQVAEALKFLQVVEKVDMIFCDIEMLEMNGLEAAPLLKKHCDSLVFLTGYKEYAFDAFGVKADGYLLKPLDKAKVLSEMEDLRHGRCQSDDMKRGQRLLLRGLEENEKVILQIKDITCVESKGHYLEVHCKSRSVPFRHRAKMDEMEEVLRDFGGFLRIHQSFIIALAAVERIVDLSVVYLPNGVTAKVSRAKGGLLREYLACQTKI